MMSRLGHQITPAASVQGRTKKGHSAQSLAAPLSAEEREQVRQRMLRARIRLALQQPFLATALMRLPVREVYEASWCATAATDGYHIFFNPRWVSRLTDSEMRGLLAHEVLHVLFTHADRRRDREPFIWNVACDYAINHLLVQRGFKLPKGGLISDKAGGKTSEQIYALLQRQLKLMGGKGQADRHGRTIPRLPGQRPTLPTGTAAGQSPNDDALLAGDEVPEVGDDLLHPDDPRIRPMRSADAPDQQQMEELRQELRQDALARLSGDGAGQFRQECRADERTRLDWRALLRAWLADRIKGDWSSFPFSKRMIHRGLFMPSPSLQVPGHVVFAIDTSGSMSKELLTRVVGELRAFREVFPCRLSVLQCDAAIQCVQEYEALDGYEIPREFNIQGRGGTDFRPVFDWVGQSAPGALVLYVTDGIGAFPQKAPVEPVLWLHTAPRACTGDQFPFGTVVPISG